MAVPDDALTTELELMVDEFASDEDESRVAAVGGVAVADMTPGSVDDGFTTGPSPSPEEAFEVAVEAAVLWTPAF